MSLGVTPQLLDESKVSESHRIQPSQGNNKTTEEDAGPERPETLHLPDQEASLQIEEALDQKSKEEIDLPANGPDDYQSDHQELNGKTEEVAEEEKS